MKVLGSNNQVESDKFRVSSQGFYLCFGKVSVHTFALGMKELHAGSSWVAKEDDPEHTPKRDSSPKKAVDSFTPTTRAWCHLTSPLVSSVASQTSVRMRDTALAVLESVRRVCRLVLTQNLVAHVALLVQEYVKIFSVFLVAENSVQ